jgi:hypothetical protein
VTQVRVDEHGLYVQAGDDLFRPTHSNRSEGYDISHSGENGTRLQLGDEVIAGKLWDQPLARLVNLPCYEPFIEIWFSHGPRYTKRGMRLIPSDQIWEPIQ